MDTPKRNDRPKLAGWRLVASGLVTLALIGATALAVALVVVPKLLGGMSLTVQSGSMEPGIKPGDIVVTRGVDVESAAQLQVGDVITFLPYPDDPLLVTHRVIAKSVSQSGVFFITQGDNNNCADPWGPVADYQVRGALVYTVPQLGWVRQWVGGQTQLVLMGLGVLLIAYGAIRFATSWRGAAEEPTPPQPAPRRAMPGP